jgi:hypothetical protein
VALIVEAEVPAGAAPRTKAVASATDAYDLCLSFASIDTATPRL